MRLNWLFPEPRGCAFCSRPVTVSKKAPLCAECSGEIGWIVDPRCEQCGRQMDSASEEAAEPLRCEDCMRFAGDGEVINRAVVRYTPLAREVVSLYKYRGRETLANVLGVMMADVVRHEYRGQSIDAITYVPLHSRREGERGFNQAELLAKVISKELRLPISSMLVRVKDTPKQSRQSRQYRIEGMERAFALKRNICFHDTLLIVDDIYTTGATLRACARELLRGGCSRVLAVTFAR